MPTITKDQLVNELGSYKNIDSIKKEDTTLLIQIKNTENINIDRISQLEFADNATIEEKKIIIEINNKEETNDLYNNIDQEIDKGGIFDFISKIFTPVIPALAGSGILKGILLLLNQFGILTESNDIYVILSIASQAIFYFLPVILAFSTASILGVNPYIALLIPFTLLHPDFANLFEEGAKLDFFNIPVVLIDYSSTVIPIILAVFLYAFIYKLLDKRIPDSLKTLVLPFLTLAIVVPIAIIGIGPIGYYSGELLASFINFLIETNSTLSGFLIAGLWLPIILSGLNWAVNPIMLNNLATYGFDFIRPFTFAANFATFGIVIGIFLSSHNKKTKSFAGTNIFTIGISGIIEPTMYGILIKNRKYFIAQILSAALGGAYLGYTNVITNAFVFGSIPTLPALITEQSSNFINGIIGLLISVVSAATFSYYITKKEKNNPIDNS